MKNSSLSRRDFLKLSGVGAAGMAALGLMGAAAAAEGEEAQAAPQGVSPLDTTVYIIDRFETKPGEGPAFLAYFMERYAPKAEAYGMRLMGTLVAPPVWLDNAPNAIELIWAISGFNGWGAIGGDRTPEVVAFWREVNLMVQSHDRSFFGSESDLEVLCNV